MCIKPGCSKFGNFFNKHESVLQLDLGIIFVEFLHPKKWSGQIIATSHDLTPNGGLVRDFPLFQGNPGW